MNNNTSLLNDPRAKRWGNFAKYSAILVTGFFVAPFIWVALGGLLGLIAAGVVMTSVWMLRPWFYSVAANMRLKLVKAEASRNPVETLEENWRKETVKLNERKTAIEKLNGQIRTFSDKVSDIAERFGKQDSDYIKLSKDLLDLDRLYKHRCQKWNEAHKKLDAFSEAINRAKMIWDASLAAAAARETSGLTEDEFFTKLRTETAFDAIQTSYNEALSSLDTALLDGDEVQAALPAPSESVNIIPMTNKVNVRS